MILSQSSLRYSFVTLLSVTWRCIVRVHSIVTSDTARVLDNHDQRTGGE